MCLATSLSRPNHWICYFMYCPAVPTTRPFPFSSLLMLHTSFNFLLEKSTLLVSFFCTLHMPPSNSTTTTTTTTDAVGCARVHTHAHTTYFLSFGNDWRICMWLASFLEHVANVCLLCTSFVSAENCNAKYTTALFPGPSNMLPAHEIAQPSSAMSTLNQDMWGCILPVDWTVKCHGPSGIFV